MLRYRGGLRVWEWRPCGRMRQGGQKLPQWGEKDCVVLRDDAFLYLHWRRGRGYRPLWWERNDPPARTRIATWGAKGDRVPIKRRVVNGERIKVPALPVESKQLLRVPLLLEFLSSTEYEDGIKRTPGYMTLRNKTIEYEITLYDPDAGMRLPVRGRTLDQLLMAVETLLGAQDAAWEEDSYLQSKMPKERKKKGA